MTKTSYGDFTAEEFKRLQEMPKRERDREIERKKNAKAKQKGGRRW